MKKTVIILIRKKMIMLVMSVAAILLLSYVALTGVVISNIAPIETGVIVIDPGHGGVDGGTSAQGLLEKDINLEISLKVKEYLEDLGHVVLMTRNEDISLDGLCDLNIGRHRKDLTARANIINASGANIFLSIHVNSNQSNSRTDGSVVFYYSKSSTGRILALDVQRALNNITVDGKKRSTHNPAPAEFFVLKNTYIPGLIVETAFITNPKEREMLKTNDFKDALARAIAQGTDKFLNRRNYIFKK